MNTTHHNERCEYKTEKLYTHNLCPAYATIGNKSFKKAAESMAQNFRFGIPSICQAVSHRTPALRDIVGEHLAVQCVLSALQEFLHIEEASLTTKQIERDL
jgi:hypothetical protein